MESNIIPTLEAQLVGINIKLTKLTPWCTILLEKPIAAQLVKRFSAFNKI
jgi:hypothetical protein